MKKVFVIHLLLLVSSSHLFAQSGQYKIVFDITSKDTADQHTVIRHVSGMSKSYPDAKLEVVVYGGALAMVLKEKSVVSQAIKELGNKPNVSFVVCAGTMKRYNIEKNQILDGVQVVPDAIIEIITKQAQGWGYIKEAH